ncbi:MAG: hypothetical protein JNG89_11675 [Planctomycetaceae bacterium]|nr:hypothetical protein [Planctomycetaceae bacterium]
MTQIHRTPAPEPNRHVPFDAERAPPAGAIAEPYRCMIPGFRVSGVE